MFVEYERLLYTGEAPLSSCTFDGDLGLKISMNLRFAIKYIVGNRVEK